MEQRELRAFNLHLQSLYRTETRILYDPKALTAPNLDNFSEKLEYSSC